MNLSSFHPNKFVAGDDITRMRQQPFREYFKSRATVVDVGCGPGIFLQLLEESGRHGVGVDLTKEFVDEINGRGLEAHCEDAFVFLNARQHSFDGAFASHLIEHFPAQQGFALIQAMFDSLKPGGRLLLITPTYHDILVHGERFWLDITHVRPYPLMLLEAAFTHLGMTIIDKGYDRNTRISPGILHLRSFLRHVIAKIRFGKFYDVGDTFIVGEKL